MRNLINIIENASGPKSLIDVAKHFLMIHDDLLDDDDEDYDDEMDEATALEVIRRNYISGTCGAFAIALHDKLSFPIVGINGGLHIAVMAPDGDIIDFAGKNPRSQVLKRYGMGSTSPIQRWTREETVDHVTDEEEGHGWDEITVAKFVMNTLGRW